jgi:hypothetical protein
MSKLFCNKAFNLGFFITFGLFGFLNYLVYIVSNNVNNNSVITFSAGGYIVGFPFVFYQVIIGHPNIFDFRWLFLIANILIAVVFSLLIGLIFKFVWSKISAPSAELK